MKTDRHPKHMRNYRSLHILLASAIIALLTLSATAYKEQKGYVKTRGRQPVNGSYKKGTYLNNVIVSYLDGKAKRTTKTVGKGEFKFTLTGTDFTLTDVDANKYVIYDKDMLGKKRRYSDNEFEILVDLPFSSNEDSRISQDNMIKNLRKEVERKNKEIDKLRKENKISDDECYKLKQQVYDYEAKSGKL